MKLVSSDDVMDVQEEEDDGAGEETNPAFGLPSPAQPTHKEIRDNDEPATKVAVWTLSEGERNRGTQRHEVVSAHHQTCMQLRTPNTMQGCSHPVHIQMLSAYVCAHHEFRTWRTASAR